MNNATKKLEKTFTKEQIDKLRNMYRIYLFQHHFYNTLLQTIQVMLYKNNYRNYDINICIKYLNLLKKDYQS